MMSRNLHGRLNIVLVKWKLPMKPFSRAVQPHQWFWLLTYIDPAKDGPQDLTFGRSQSRLLQRGSIGLWVSWYTNCLISTGTSDSQLQNILLNLYLVKMPITN